MKRAALNIILLAASVAVSLVVGEVAARIFFRDITTTADNRSYFAMRWKEREVRLNSAGFREREFARSKPAGAYRIAFIGDSYAFGQGIADADRMSNLLETRLRDRRPGVEVLNFGNAGNNTNDELAVLRTVLTDVDPDFVLLQWYVNDVEGKFDGPAASAAPAATAAPAPPRLNEWRTLMRSSSVLYFLAGEVAHRVQDSLGSSRTDDIVRRSSDPASPDSRQAYDALRLFLATARSAGVGVGVVLVPELSPLTGDGYRLQYLHERVLAQCRSAGVSCLDLLDAFTPFLADGRAQELWVNRFDSHMGQLANRLATDQIVAVFGPAWEVARPGELAPAASATAPDARQ